ncbi:MAG: replicative DNA helicase [Betaproteobacteria bacterium]|nr:replicative DNA helicase [Betaproteobacteria bacterium]
MSTLPDLDALVLPPHSIEAEQAVLGGLLIDNSAWDGVIADKLSEADFYAYAHREIFRAIAQLAREDKSIDAVTVAERVKAISSNSSDEPDLAYIGQLALGTPTAANIGHYADLVKERSVLRALASIGNECARKATDRMAKSDEVLESVEKALFAVSQNQNERDFIDVRAGFDSVVDTIEKHYESGDPVTGVTTGLQDLDRMTAGLQPADLVIVAARPSMGKTGFAMGLVRAALSKYKDGHVQLYSLEMPADQIIFRLLAQESHLPMQRMMQGNVNEDDWQQISDAIGRFDPQASRLLLDDSPSLTPTVLRAKARRAARKHGVPKLIIIDYLQLMRSEGRPENRNMEITDISRSLKALAKEMNCPVIALSQLNRALEQRANKRPLLADLRESGAIEQDADLIIFIYRDEVYNLASPDHGCAEIIIGKHRNGPTGMVRAAFLADQARFADFVENVWGGRS